MGRFNYSNNYYYRYKYYNNYQDYIVGSYNNINK